MDGCEVVGSGNGGEGEKGGGEESGCVMGREKFGFVKVSWGYGGWSVRRL